jgi:aminoglycoside 6'-N-acetyltransferase I
MGSRLRKSVMDSSFIVRLAYPRDRRSLADMFHTLWPEASLEEHSRDLYPVLNEKLSPRWPGAIFLAEGKTAGPVGFIHVNIRSHADGCDPSNPVGFIEGWYVAPNYRRQHSAAQLLSKAEAWARKRGCREMASDTWVGNLNGQRVHEALGFTVIDRCVHYQKRVGLPS